MHTDGAVLEKCPYAHVINFYISISSKKQRGMFSRAWVFCLGWEQVLGWKAQKWVEISSGMGSKAELSFCWETALDSDNDLRICSRPTHWATQQGGGAATAQDSPRAESRMVIWPEDGLNLQVNGKGPDEGGGGAPTTCRAFRWAVEGGAVAEWCPRLCPCSSLNESGPGRRARSPVITPNSSILSWKPWVTGWHWFCCWCKMLVLTCYCSCNEPMMLWFGPCKCSALQAVTQLKYQTWAHVS